MSTLLVMAGGTGGHVFPALAVARILRDRGVKIVWLGTRNGLEAKTVPDAGFDIEWINIRGVRGKGLSGWIRTPFLLSIAIIQTMVVIFRRRPQALLGMGGFVSGPGGFVAWLLRRPLLIHEANALAGMTNRYLAKLANRVMTGFPGTFVDSRVHEEHVGNPVRPEICAVPIPEQRLSGRTGPLRVLIVGGSQGARALNVKVPRILGDLARKHDFRVWHQTGTVQEREVSRVYSESGVRAKVNAFINDMAEVYEWADLVLCRAGAMTVAEVSAAGVCAVFVPFPHAVGDHQTANANYLVEQEAAYLVSEHRLTEDLPRVLEDLFCDRKNLLTFASRARTLAKPDATRQVADICMETLHA